MELQMSTVRCCLPLCLPQAALECGKGQIYRGSRQRSEWLLLVSIVKLHCTMRAASCALPWFDMLGDEPGKGEPYPYMC
jgi:hypothetical protein